jgi:hypothetical protein
MPSCELHWRRLPEDEHNFWKIFAPSGLFIILISLVMLQLLRRCWHREAETEEKPTQLQMISQGGESSMRQSRSAIGARRTLPSIAE